MTFSNHFFLFRISEPALLPPEINHQTFVRPYTYALIALTWTCRLRDEIYTILTNAAPTLRLLSNPRETYRRLNAFED